ncbi:MAG: type II toxin-antitoxin system VapC family toxin [Austwickia sp.]|nr:type II toxin-antitoxin system VapC family toxin [Actinomycetota bacterium]MCB1252531.1 type II toxin-antitoxin system VapC family toxin [Austwickia sp.]MCO5308955.1 type II toxin-antitoxin system VapC family toxin [Austwickia sp.]
MAVYLDTSALVKLVVAEPESDALRTWLVQQVDPVTSDLARTELARAVRRVAPDLMPAARGVLDVLTILTLDAEIFEAAGRLDPAELRSLDAVHLASALSLGDDLTAVVTYDDRQAAAATAYGVSVIAPG